MSGTPQAFNVGDVVERRWVEDELQQAKAEDLRYIWVEGTITRTMINKEGVLRYFHETYDDEHDEYFDQVEIDAGIIRLVRSNPNPQQQQQMHQKVYGGTVELTSSDPEASDAEESDSDMPESQETEYDSEESDSEEPDSEEPDPDEPPAEPATA